VSGSAQWGLKFGTPTDSSQTVNDPRFAEIIGRHLQFHPIAEIESDKALSHFAWDVRKYHLVIGKLYAKHRSRENWNYLTFDWDRRFIGHGKQNLVWAMSLISVDGSGRMIYRTEVIRRGRDAGMSSQRPSNGVVNASTAKRIVLDVPLSDELHSQ
jgi:hypothetical protein